MNDTVLVSRDPPRSSDSILPRGARARLANLAFGSGSARASTALSSDGLDLGKHLAYLPDEALDLDLSDPAQRRFGDYELLELIGQGGMGVVYRARQVSLDREVAVKLLSAGPWASSEFIERFQSEAQNAARMQHPNIVPIHEVGAVDGLHFFSMRLVRGTSLAHVIRFGPQPTTQRAAQLLRTIAEAVDYAHRLGVLHLDLKPANVLLDEAGEPHVADFGLARRIDQGAADDRAEISGTPAYMSPEQATPGRRISSAADVWGLGAIGYELLTGHVPFEGNSAHEILHQVVRGALRRPREIVPLLSRDFEAIVLKCMAHDPADRYRSARELADDLGRLLENRPVRARPLNRLQRLARWTRRQPYVAAFATLFAVSLITGIVGVSAQWRRAERSVDQASRTLWDSRDATSERQIIEGEAYRALDGALANLREMEARGVSGRAALERLRIGTVLANAPRLIDAIALGSDIDQLEFAPDGTTLAALSGSVIHLIDVASGAERWSIDATRFSSGAAPERKGVHVSMHISRDSRRLIAEFPPSGPAPRQVDEVMVDIESGEIVRPPGDFDLRASDYALEGTFALLFDHHDRMQLWRVLPWSPISDLVPVGHEGHANDSVGTFDDVIVSDDGKVIVAAYDHYRTLRTLDAKRLQPKRVLKLADEQGRGTQWMLSHDGRWLAAGTANGRVVLWDTGDGRARWLQSAAGSPDSEVPFQNGTIMRLAFSTDDRLLFAAAYRPSDLRVFDTSSGELAMAPISFGDVTPDGAGFGDGNRAIWLRSKVLGTRVLRLPETRAWQVPAMLAAPLFPGEQTRFAMTREAAPRLMAHADNGMIKIWRSPPPPLGERIGAPLVADAIPLRGSNLVSVAGNRVEVFDATSQAVLGTPIELPQAPTFAGLTADGQSIVAISGRRLCAWDWRTGASRWPVRTLENSPAHVSMAADAPVIAVTTSRNSSDGGGELVQIVDLRTGALHGPPIPFQWQQFPPRLSPDGKRLLSWVWSDAKELEPTVLAVIDTANPDRRLRLVQTAKEGTSIGDARFADDGSIWSTTSGGDDIVWHWSARGDLLLSKHLVSTRNHWLGQLLPLPAGRGVIVLGAASGNAPLLVEPDGTARPLPGAPVLDMLNVAALSEDGKSLALATRNSVMLVDAEKGQRLLPDLKLTLPWRDSIQQIAFSRTAMLVGRTVYGRWFGWQLRADLRPLAEIERDLDLRHFDRTIASAPALSADERRRLRAADPGPAKADEGTAGHPVEASLEPLLDDPRYIPLDLAPIANVDPRLIPKGWPPALPTLPRGPQRYDGVDFQLGLGMQLGGGSWDNDFASAYPRQSKILSVQPQNLSAVDVLAFQFSAFTGEAIHVDIHYVDGGVRELPIVEGRDVVSQADEQDRPSEPARRHVGWQGVWAENFGVGGAGFNLGEATPWWSFVVHLENPEPQRPVSGISFGARPEAAGLLVLALTLEPGTVTERNGQHDTVP